MNQNVHFKEWFVHERARALASVLLTRREDLLVKETKEENGLDFTIYILDKENGAKRPFAILLEAAMSPVTEETANQLLRPALASLQSRGPFVYPVCVFYFTAKDDQGFYTWAYEPVVTNEGQPKLNVRAQADCRKLSNEALDEIVSVVNKWYDVLYATITT